MITVTKKKIKKRRKEGKKERKKTVVYNETYKQLPPYHGHRKMGVIIM